MSVPRTESEQSDLIQQLQERTRDEDEQGIGATRAGCRAALQSSAWDVDVAMRLLEAKPWMAAMQPSGKPPINGAS